MVTVGRSPELYVAAWAILEANFHGGLRSDYVSILSYPSAHLQDDNLDQLREQTCLSDKRRDI